MNKTWHLQWKHSTADLIWPNSIFNLKKVPVKGFDLNGFTEKKRCMRVERNHTCESLGVLPE